MSFQRFTQNAISQWMKGNGPDSDIVISSRIRLARNLNQLPFPLLATEAQAEQVIEKVQQVVQNNDFRDLADGELIRMDELSPLERRVLMEKHLISPNLAEESRKGAVILSENESISIMINEEDHIRIQVLFSGAQLNEAWELANRIDNLIEQKLDYAFCEQRGYLTSCPTNAGTGIRASMMMHLPALAMTQQMNRILSAINQVGLVVRGIYGEGSEAAGNLFQISNQITLGQSELEIISNLNGVAKQIIEQERTARHYLIQSNRIQLEDRLCRSYGILTNARIMESKEATQRLSDVHLGIDLGLIRTNISPHVIQELMVAIQPGFLQQISGKQLTPEQRDERRARLIREKLMERK